MYVWTRPECANHPYNTPTAACRLYSRGKYFTAPGIFDPLTCMSFSVCYEMICYLSVLSAALLMWHFCCWVHDCASKAQEKHGGLYTNAKSDGTQQEQLLLVYCGWRTSFWWLIKDSYWNLNSLVVWVLECSIWDIISALCIKAHCQVAMQIICVILTAFMFLLLNSAASAHLFPAARWGELVVTWAQSIISIPQLLVTLQKVATLQLSTGPDNLTLSAQHEVII